jgi:hypothetical protein
MGRFTRKIQDTVLDVLLGRRVYDLWAENMHFYRCVRFVRQNRVEGDLLQFGVAAGNSLTRWERMLRFCGDRPGMTPRRVFGFDSFEGLPEPKGVDKEAGSGKHFRAGLFHQGPGGKERVEQRLARDGADMSRLTLTKGFYDAVCTPELRQELGLERAAIIDLDCDFYESTRDALAFCLPLIQQGTILTFDDWWCYAGSEEHGQKLAVNELLAANPQLSLKTFSRFNWHGQAFVVSVKGG